MKYLFAFLLFCFVFPVISFAGQSSASAGAAVNFAPQFNSVSRAYPGPAQMVQPNIPTLFSNPGRSVNYMPVNQMMKLKKLWTMGDVQNFLKNATTDELVAKIFVVKKYKETKSVSFLLKMPDDDFVYIGNVVLVADQTSSGDVNSETLLATAARVAMAKGGNALLLCTEGSSMYLHSSGNVVSLGYTSMTMGSSYAGVAGAGVGHAWGNAQYLSRPYVRFAILRIK